MENPQRLILILIILAGVVNIPTAGAQTSPRLSLTLIGQTTARYVAPAGKTTVVRLQILNEAASGIYLLLGESYLDLNLNGTWDLIHSEALGKFQLSYLQSAVWTFDLPVPLQIQAANATNGVPQVNLLIKITYQAAGGQQSTEQEIFPLSVPGATLQAMNNTNLFLVFIILIGIGVTIVFGLARRRKRA